MATLNLNVTVPDAQATDILNDFCVYQGYKSIIKDDQGNEIPNPQTKAQFAKAVIANFVKESIKSYRANASAEIARLAKITEVEAISII